MVCPMQTYSNYCLVDYIRSVNENNLMCLNISLTVDTLDPAGRPRLRRRSGTPVTAETKCKTRRHAYRVHQHKQGLKSTKKNRAD